MWALIKSNSVLFSERLKDKKLTKMKTLLLISFTIISLASLSLDIEIVIDLFLYFVAGYWDEKGCSFAIDIGIFAN